MTLQELMQRAVGTYGMIKVSIADATVISVDESTRTCKVNLEGATETDGLKVRLMASISDGKLEIPSIDSTVIIAFRENIVEPLIIKTRYLDKIVYIVENSSIEINPDELLLNDGSYGGLVKVKELVDRINILEKTINDIKSGFQQLLAVVNEPGNGQPSAFQAKFILAFQTYAPKKLVETKRKDIENETVKHGKHPE